MKIKRIAQYCCAALVVAGAGLNIQNAIADYGIGENSLSLVADPGSNSGSNSNSNSNSNNQQKHYKCVDKTVTTKEYEHFSVDFSVGITIPDTWLNVQIVGAKIEYDIENEVVWYWQQCERVNSGATYIESNCKNECKTKRVRLS